MSFVAHESILKAPRKWGLTATFFSALGESAKFQQVLTEALRGKTAKYQEDELIKSIARLEIVLSQIVFFMDIKPDVDKQINVDLEILTDRILSKDKR